MLVWLFQPAISGPGLITVRLRREDHDFVIRRLSGVSGSDCVTAVERPDRSALERELGVVCEPLGERLPIPRTDAFVVHHYVVVQESDRRGHVQIITHQRVQRGVCPVTVAPIRLAAHALPCEADTLGVPLRPLVEVVDLELEPVIAELQHEVALQQARCLVGDALPSMVRMNGQPLELGDP